MGTATESGLTESISNRDQVAQGNDKYPEHMIFDPQYPGWYYDTIAQEWRANRATPATSLGPHICVSSCMDTFSMATFMPRAISHFIIFYFENNFPKPHFVNKFFNSGF